MPIRTPRKVTINAVTPVSLRDNSRPAAANSSFFYSGGNVRFGISPSMTFSSGSFPLTPDTVQNLPAGGSLFALCEADTVEIEIVEFDN